MLRSIQIVFFFFTLFISIGVEAQEIQQKHLIKSIYFGGGSYYIDELQTQELIQFLDSIPGIEQYEITIHSHTDNIGGARYNEWLSQQRSNMTIRELLNYNISKEMIEIKDFGQFNPVYDNSTMLGRLKNRRVDIILWPVSM